MEENKNPLGRLGCLVIITGIFVAFIFGNKELGKTLLDIGVWIIILPIAIGVIYMIYMDYKNKQ